MAFSTPSTTLLGFLVLLVAAIRFGLRLRFQRGLVKGLPGPPHHPIFGHLLIFRDLRERFPARLHPHYYPHLIKEKYGLGDVFYLDLWPIAADAFCILASPDVANQAMVKPSLPKHKAVVDFMVPIGGHTNMVATEGTLWRKARSMFNPGFAASNLMSLVPVIVDHAAVFQQILAEHADKGDVFRLEEAATRLTVDIIGAVVMDTNLNSQRSENELVQSFRKQIAWLQTIEDPHPLRSFNPVYWAFRSLAFRWYSRKMERYISTELDNRFASRGSVSTRSTKRKYVVDIALDTYADEEQRDPAKGQSYDQNFKSYAVDQMRTFIFAGHDTTSSTICYVYHLLNKHPEAMAKVRKEYDEIFGTDLSQTAELIKQDPHLLNKLEYTLAVIKEILRLYPPASSVRRREKGYFIKDPKTGESLPTEHFTVWPVPVCNHRHIDFWDEPNAFVPERWLFKDGEQGGAAKDAWIAFGKGPRNCIGQELALLETKIIMVLTLRTFDVRAAYEDLKALKNDGTNWPTDDRGVQQAIGEEAYQVLLATAKPREGMPARVAKRVMEVTK